MYLLTPSQFETANTHNVNITAMTDYNCVNHSDTEITSAICFGKSPYKAIMYRWDGQVWVLAYQNAISSHYCAVPTRLIDNLSFDTVLALLNH